MVIMHIKFKGNRECGNMVANVLPADSTLPPPPTPPTLGVGSKGQNSTFSEHGHVDIKFKGITNAATW